MSPRVTVGVASVRAETLPDTIESILAQTVSDLELLVCGQGDGDAEVKAVVGRAAAADDRVRYIHTPTTGLSVARNRILECATATIVAFTDDDCEAEPDWAEQLLDVFERHPRVGLVGGPVVAPPRPRTLRPASCPARDTPTALYDHEVGFDPPPAIVFIGANFAIRRSVGIDLGGFDEHLGAGARFPAGEDSDLGFRIDDARIPFATTERAIVHHTHGYRVGFRSRHRQMVAYAYGNGALAEKRRLVKPHQADEWVESMRAVCFRSWFPFRVDRLMLGVVRWRHFTAGREDYRRVVDG